MKLVALFFALICALPASAGTFREHRTYSHHLFINEASCEGAQRLFMRMNCMMSLHLNPDGTASVMLTDIMNPAKYDIQGRKLIVTRVGEGDMPEQMVFLMERTERNLIREGAVQVWELEKQVLPTP